MGVLSMSHSNWFFMKLIPQQQQTNEVKLMRWRHISWVCFFAFACFVLVINDSDYGDYTFSIEHLRNFKIDIRLSIFKINLVVASTSSASMCVCVVRCVIIICSAHVWSDERTNVRPNTSIYLFILFMHRVRWDGNEIRFNHFLCAVRCGCDFGFRAWHWWWSHPIRFVFSSVSLLFFSFFLHRHCELSVHTLNPRQPYVRRSLLRLLGLV